MSDQFDFISATDKPALLAITAPEWLSAAQLALLNTGYKVHQIMSHSDFPGRFSQVPYRLVIVEEEFGGNPVHENLTLQVLQRMPMNQRRHSTILLLGNSYQTLNTAQAFQNSVHAVVNYSEMNLLGQIAEKVVTENDLFLNNFREIQLRVAQTQK
ncbi:MAG: hypothetical protein ABIP71_09545 [Verrucomicrobiota bacterium]